MRIGKLWLLFLSSFVLACDSSGQSTADAGLDLSVDAEVVGEIDANTQPLGEVGGPLRAFPSARGAGANAIGGRGGRVIHVTTLEWDAAGGLKEALEQTEPRTIVFDVSGSIEVPDYFYTLSGPQYSNLTIAGQTAPEGGINIVSYGKFGILNMDEVIIRYVRFVDKSRFHEMEGNWQALDVSGIHNLVLDHCSFRYTWNSANLVATDNNRDIGQNNYSIQRNLFGESGSTGVLLGASAQRPTKAGNNSFHYNAFYNTSHRFPNTGGNGNFEVFNNLVYNWANRLSSFYNEGEISQRGNYFLPGPRSQFFVGNYGGSYGNYMHQLGVGFSGKLYSEGNHYEGFSGAAENQWLAIFAWIGQSYTQSQFELEEAPEFLGVPVEIIPAEEAFDTILEDVGSNAYLDEEGRVHRYLDEVDSTYISDIRSGTQSYARNTQNFEFRSMTNESELDYPELRNQRPAGFDTDRDGMPDVWEESRGLDPMVADDAEDDDDDGYTNLEEYIDLVDL